MLDNTLTFDYNGTSVTLTRVNQDNFSSEYFGTNGDDKLRMNVKHTIPARGESGESHMVRLDTEHYSDGAYAGTTSAWTVIKSFDRAQDNAKVDHASAALIALLNVGDLRTAVLNRES